MTDPVARLLETYAEGLEGKPGESPNINRLEQRVRSTLRERSLARKRSVTRLQVALALAAGFALVSGGVAYTFGKSSAPSAASTVPAGDWVTTTKGVAEERKFDDGSSLRLEGESSARVQFVLEKGGLVHLDRGAVKLKVHHRDGSTWRVAAGPYEVEAIGTEFTVDWVASRDKPLRVSVTEGTVAVRGPAFRGTRFVSAHQMVEVTSPEGAPSSEPVVAPAPVPVSVDSLSPEVAAELPGETSSNSPHAVRERSWRELEDSGKYADSVKAAERKGLSGIYQAGAADDLLALARAARFAGRMDVARDALMACRARFAGSPQAAMSAFLLGRSANGAQAAQWFSAYLKEQPGGALAREALGRLIEAYQAAGDRVSSRSAAERYLKSYPDGPHATLAREALHR
ncbi:MAG TPA: FecR domain-containing protein [Polyangiaceae bacterium]|nr:FecR domain-containing protein [Polyangiaceae bacterium]